MYRPSERPVSVSGGFWLLLGWFAWGCGWAPLVSILAAAAVHELGHYTVLRSFGAAVHGLRIRVLGAVMEADTARLTYGQELLAVLAGPAANLFWAAAVSVVAKGRLTAFVGANVVLCLFNLLPVCPLDGGRALYLLLSWRFGTAAGERVAAWTGLLGGIALGAAVCCVTVFSGGSLWLLPAAAGVLTASVRLWKKKL